MQICPFFGNLCNLSYTKRNPQWTNIGNLPPITVPCVSLTTIMSSSSKTWVKKVKNFSKWLISNNLYLMIYGIGIWIQTDQKKCLGNEFSQKKINIFLQCSKSVDLSRLKSIFAKSTQNSYFYGKISQKGVKMDWFE